MISLSLLPLSLVLKLNNIIFFLKSFQSPSASFNILDYIIFSISSTCTASKLKLTHSFSSKIPHSTFSSIGYLVSGIVSLPYPKLNFLWLHFTSNMHFTTNISPQISTPLIHVHTALNVSATYVCQHPTVTLSFLVLLRVLFALAVMTQCL